MKIINPISILSRAERVVHAIFWLVLLILINIPEWHVHLGPFRSEDFSLIIPSIYGSLLKAYIFYHTINRVQLAYHSETGKNIRISFLMLTLVTLLESTLDSGYYVLFYWEISTELFTEILLSEFLMNFVFFYLTAVMYGFVKAWQAEEIEDPDDSIQ